MYYNSDTSGATERAEWVAGQIPGYPRCRACPGTDRWHDAGRAAQGPRVPPAALPRRRVDPGLPGSAELAQRLLDLRSTFAQRVGYCNEEFDKLTELGDTTLDPEERLTYYQQAGEILVEDVPGPFLYNLAGIVRRQSGGDGYTPTPSEIEWPGSASSLMTIDITE